MEQIKVVKFMEKNKDHLFPNDLHTEDEIEAMLLEVPDFHVHKVYNVSLRDPKLLQLISVFPGVLGVDRFLLGDIKMGALKYITLGGFWIWWIADIKSAKSRCRNYNCRKLVEALGNIPTTVAGPKAADDFEIDNI